MTGNRFVFPRSIPSWVVGAVTAGFVVVVVVAVVVVDMVVLGVVVLLIDNMGVLLAEIVDVVAATPTARYKQDRVVLVVVG